MSSGREASPDKVCTKCCLPKPRDNNHFHKDSTKPDGLYPVCKECRRAVSATFYQKNAEAIKERVKRHRFPQTIAGGRTPKPRKQGAPIEVVRRKKTERMKQAYAQNPQKFIDYQMRYRKERIDQLRPKRRVWTGNRRARELAALGKHTADDIASLLAKQEHRCYWCSIQLNNAYDVDHIIPLSRGGTNYPDNLCIACRSCNRSRGNKLPSEWKRRP